VTLSIESLLDWVELLGRTRAAGFVPADLGDRVAAAASDLDAALPERRLELVRR
jgi:hypothetical protein